MAQTVFYSDLNAFCRKYLVKVEGVPPPNAVEFATDGIQQQMIIFENLMLFEKLSIKITGESIPISMLINSLGMSGLYSLIEQEAIEFVLWNQGIVYVVENIPGIDALASMAYNGPEYNDPERSIEAGLRWMREAPTGRKRRKLVRRLVPLFRLPEKGLSEASVKAVNQSLHLGGMEPYGIPKIPGPADSLTDLQKRVVAKSAEDFTEYEFLVKHNMTSFSNYSYFSPFWASAERFQMMNRTVAGFSAMSTLEGVPDLKALFHEIEEPLKKVSKIRKTRNAVRFREWLEKTAGESPDIDMVKSYLDSISNRKGIMDSTPRKLLKSVAMAAIGVGVESAATAYAGAHVGTVAGVGATLTTVAAEKIAEFATHTGIGVFDTFLLERVTKGWSPRMFFDDLSRIRKSK